MSLKQIKPKHREIIRRIITHQTPEEIALEMRVSEGYLAALRREPLFNETLEAMDAEIHVLWLEKRGKAMDILEASAPDAAKLCVDAVSGEVDGLAVPLNKRLDSAWDVLNRTGVKAVEKRIVANVTLQDMIIAAYEQRNGKSGHKGDDDSEVVDLIPERTETVRMDN